MIKIRDAKPDDAAVLRDAENQIVKTPGSLASRPHELKTENFLAKIAGLTSIPNGRYIVAEIQGRIVGHAMLEPMGLEAVRHVVRLTIAVHPGNERQGVGEQMLKILIDWAMAAPDVEKIELHVRSINLAAISLYQKLGFVTEGRLRNRMRLPNGNFVDDIEMGLFVKARERLPTTVSLAIGTVASNRREVIDDNWDSIESYILLDSQRFTPEALQGLESFSHVEVIFFMNQVDPGKIETSARHPRNNSAWPKIGIFAQRGKNRPNQLGLTICRIKKVEGLKLFLEGLDAVDATPVLDIKPWIKEFGPRGGTHQPEWATELMRGYWS